MEVCQNSRIDIVNNKLISMKMELNSIDDMNNLVVLDLGGEMSGRLVVTSRI